MSKTEAQANYWNAVGALRLRLLVEQRKAYGNVVWQPPIIQHVDGEVAPPCGACKTEKGDFCNNNVSEKKRKAECTRLGGDT